MSKIVTTKTLEAMRPGTGVPDGLVPNVRHVKYGTGKVACLVKVRVNGVQEKHTLPGPYELKEAREWARDILLKVRQGISPAAEKKAARAAAKAQKPVAHDLVEVAGEQFIMRHIRATMRPSWAHEAERMMRKEIMAPWAGRRLSEIGRPDIHVLLDAISDRPAPVVAEKTFKTLRRFYAWCIDRGIVEGSPCVNIKRARAEKSRDRVLGDDELRRIWLGCKTLGYPFGPLFQLLILTGARLGEASGMRWPEIDLASNVWVLPAERSKNKQAHCLALPPLAIAILENLPRIESEEGYAFTTNGKTPVSGFSRAKRRLDAFTGDMPAWVIHDLRRSFASGLQRLGISLPVIERCLNHVSGSFAGVVGVYQRDRLLPEQRRAFEAWGQHIESLVAGNVSDNVVRIPRKGV